MTAFRRAVEVSLGGCQALWGRLSEDSNTLDKASPVAVDVHGHVPVAPRRP